MFGAAPSVFQAFKLTLVDAAGLSKDALHVYAGLTVWLTSVVVLRRPIRTLLPLAVVLAVAILGEARDAADDIATLGHWRIAASAHDLVNTLFWPTIFVLLARCTGVLRR
jgi:hypothetical protein